MTQTDLTSLGIQVRTKRRDLDTLATEKRLIVDRARNLQSEIKELNANQAILDRTTVFLNSLGEDRQNAAQQTIEELVTRGLQTIFNDTITFHIVQTTKAKTANVEFILRTHMSNGDTLDTSVMDARGGGYAAVVGFLLRLVVMLLRGGKNQENIIVLDETFSHVSAEYLDSLGEFIREIVDKTGIQIFMVTHQEEFREYADKVYNFSLGPDERTIVREDS